MSWWSGLVAALVRPEAIGVSPERLSSSMSLDALPRRAALRVRHVAAVVDGGVVQVALRAGRVVSPLDRLRRDRLNWRDPIVLVWTFGVFPIRIALPAIVSSDGHGFTVVVDLRVRLEPACEPGAVAPDLPASTDSIEDMIRAPLTAVLRGPAHDVTGAMLFETWPADPAVAAWCVEAARGALAGIAVVEHTATLRAANAFFEAQRLRQLQHGTGAEALAALEVQSLVRGGCRLVAHRERIDALQKESEFAAVEAILQQDVELRRKASQQELARADVNAAMERAEHAKLQAAAVIEMVDAASRMQSSLFESASQLATHLGTELNARSGDVAFTAQERQQVQTLLAEAARTARSPQEVLAALQSGLPLPVSLFNPFRKLEGAHVVRVGTEWRAFDGKTLWKVYVARVSRRRHGWFWRKESASAVELKITGRPEGRELRWVVRIEETTQELGDHTLRGHLLPGSRDPAELRFN